jgi:hypothetical protein
MGKRHGTTDLGWYASNRLGSHGSVPPAGQAQAERDWEFSVGAFGGKAFHSNEDVKINFGEGSGATTGTAHGE